MISAKERPDKSKLLVVLPTELHDLLRERCDHEDTSVARLVRRLIREYLNETSRGL